MFIQEVIQKVEGHDFEKETQENVKGKIRRRTLQENEVNLKKRKVYFCSIKIARNLNEVKWLKGVCSKIVNVLRIWVN